MVTTSPSLPKFHYGETETLLFMGCEALQKCVLVTFKFRSSTAHNPKILAGLSPDYHTVAALAARVTKSNKLGVSPANLLNQPRCS